MEKDILAEEAGREKIYKELGGKYICPVCGEIFKKKKVNSNLYFAFGILCVIASFYTSWVLLLLVALIMDYFRKHKKCAKCGSKNLILIKSQVGKQIACKYYSEKQDLIEKL
ncbi:MAG: hypothetical protein IKN62_03005 [Elusimicrobia bacterium]|nr:hypothetical protein [Elusimicrobiota bacterium]